MKRKFAPIITIVALATLPVSAMAATVYRYGDTAESDGTFLTVCDNNADGNSVYSEYNGAARFEVFRGNGTCESIGASVSKFNVCQNRPWYPDACSTTIKP
jgi:hypothetical protein